MASINLTQAAQRIARRYVSSSTAAPADIEPAAALGHQAISGRDRPRPVRPCLAPWHGQAVAWTPDLEAAHSAARERQAAARSRCGSPSPGAASVVAVPRGAVHLSDPAPQARRPRGRDPSLGLEAAGVARPVRGDSADPAAVSPSARDRRSALVELAVRRGSPVLVAPGSVAGRSAHEARSGSCGSGWLAAAPPADIDSLSTVAETWAVELVEAPRGDPSCPSRYDAGPNRAPNGLPSGVARPDASRESRSAAEGSSAPGRAG